MHKNSTLQETERLLMLHEHSLDQRDLFSNLSVFQSHMFEMAWPWSIIGNTVLPALIRLGRPDSAVGVRIHDLLILLTPAHYQSAVSTSAASTSEVPFTGWTGKLTAEKLVELVA